MNGRRALFAVPLVWGMTALAQEADDSAPAHHVIHHSGAAADDTDDDLSPKPKAPPLPTSTHSAPVVKPLPGPVRQVSPPIGSEEGDDLLGPAPAKAAPKPAPKAKPAKAAKEKKRPTEVAAPVPPTPSPSAEEDSSGPSHAPIVRHAAPAEENDDFVPLPKPAAPPSKKHKAAADVPRKAAPADAFSFDLLPEEKHGSVEEQLRLDREVSTRRSMLQFHQALGISTAALMAATVITGQLNFSDKFGGNGNSGGYELWHSAFEAATVVAFLSAGALALFAPVPYGKKSSGVDTVTVHKYSMLVASLGMAAEVPLGIVTVTREGYTDQATLALIHLVIGYVTAAALGTGATALFF